MTDIETLNHAGFYLIFHQICNQKMFQTPRIVVKEPGTYIESLFGTNAADIMKRYRDNVCLPVKPEVTISLKTNYFLQRENLNNSDGVSVDQETENETGLLIGLSLYNHLNDLEPPRFYLDEKKRHDGAIPPHRQYNKGTFDNVEHHLIDIHATNMVKTIS